MSASEPGEFRHHLRTSGSGSAGPYGYSLTVWGTGTVGIDELGKPGVVQVLLLVAGAVAAFVLVEAAAYGTLRPHRGERPEPPRALWGNAHWLAAGGAIALAWVVDRVLGTGVAWPLAGFAATAAFLLLQPVEALLAERAEGLQADRSGESPSRAE